MQTREEKDVATIKNMLETIENTYPKALFETKDAKAISDYLDNCIWTDSVTIDGQSYEGTSIVISTYVDFAASIEKTDNNGV